MKIQNDSERVIPIWLMIALAMLFIIGVLIVIDKPVFTFTVTDQVRPAQYYVDDIGVEPVAVASRTVETKSSVVFDDEQLEYLAGLIKKTIKNEFSAIEMRSTVVEANVRQEYFDDYQIQQSQESLQTIEAEIVSLSDASTFDDFNRIRELKMDLTPDDHGRFLKHAGELFMSEQISGEQLGKILN